MARFTRRLTQVRFQDSVGLGLTITPTEGNLTIGEINAENAEHQPVFDRDSHDGFTLGQDLVQECAISVQMKNESLTDATNARILDFLRKAGSFASASSVDPTIWAWETIVTFSDGTTTTTKTLPKCEGGVSFSEGQPANMFNITFRNHVVPTVT